MDVELEIKIKILFETKKNLFYWIQHQQQQQRNIPRNKKYRLTHNVWS